ncbi:hypothetical protein THRCLA_01384 [Thraustotheca clavata]|uniref:Protein kinase domain-containing protein n=1 Tax=Thraustotheca clavata TaxID=74557 RepID=A0A1W0A8F5_9STRA|nr:hypothetical protein THRCLA_01384 [Thraustotheca clavata]
MNESISIDENNCLGKVMPLWENKSNLSFTVCVLPDISVIIGCVCGAFIVVFIILFLRNRMKQRDNVYTEFQNAAQRTPNDSGLDVEGMRVHKIDMVDLKVMSKETLSSGAFGEVWLSQYLKEKIAIEYEIELMAMMESEFIVEFIGVSWRRLVDLEVIGPW